MKTPLSWKIKCEDGGQALTDKQTLINMLIVRIEDTPMPRLYDWEEKQIVIEALKLLADAMRGGTAK